jgi:hypothetical protein
MMGENPFPPRKRFPILFQHRERKNNSFRIEISAASSIGCERERFDSARKTAARKEKAPVYRRRTTVNRFIVALGTLTA